MSLTKSLLSSSSPQSIDRATKHPFLQQAGNGTLPAPTLCQWLQQDIHYTRAYIRFMGGLLNKLHLPPTLLVAKDADSNTTSTSTTAAVKERRLMQRIFDLIVFALNNIQREMGFFETTIQEYGLQLADGVEDVVQPVTRAYQDFFASVGGSHAGLLEGLVALWATEWCYLNAWRYAAQQLPEDEPGDESPANIALRTQFIPNWSSSEFQDFVTECEGVLNALAEHDGVTLEQSHGDRAADLQKRCEGVFRQVLWLEGGFWPEVPLP